MIYAPPVGRMWDPSILWYDGQYYMFAMHDEGKGSHNMWIAASPDGVHWVNGAPEDVHPPMQGPIRPEPRQYERAARLS